jgi:Animal haem peroxidase
MATDIAAPAENGLDPNRDELGPVAIGLAQHGIPGVRGQVAASGKTPFGQLFPELEQKRPLTTSEDDPDSLKALADAMIERPGTFNPSTRIPAGFTYFGQFVDHDLTFDPTSTLGRRNLPNELPDFRSPRFDLDSLYGSGPMDDAFMYDWETPKDPGVKLLVGHNPEGKGFADEDLPRNEQERALVGDPRNDENLIIAQLVLLFIRFHNKVVDFVRGTKPGMSSTELFVEAQKLVRWHYQWIVKHDLLPLIVSKDLLDVLPSPFDWDTTPTGPPMPVEFSGAGYRFGHSMVRPDYKLNDHHPNVPVFVPRVASGPTLEGFRRLPQDLEIEWKHFFAIDPATRPQMSMRIDASLVEQLVHLPPDSASLPYLNLRRGNALGLPRGNAVAEHLEGVTQLSTEELQAALPLDADAAREYVVTESPLWYYVLAEARARGDGGLRLGPTGGRIVAAVINGLLKADPNSYVRVDPGWTPTFANPSGAFTMADLVSFTLGPTHG